MSEKELAQKILSWIERTQQENMQDDISLQQVTDRYQVLIEDIEKLCKEHGAKPKNTGWCIVQDHGPELVYLPPGTQIVPPNHDEKLWQIAKKVAEIDSTCDGEEDIHGIPTYHFCPFCGNEQKHAARLNDEDFPHDPTCIVTIARQLMEWRKVHAEK